MKDQQEMVTQIAVLAAEVTAELTAMHTERKAIARALLGCGSDPHQTLSVQIGGLCSELKGWREGAAATTEAHEKSVRATLVAAIAHGKVVVSKGAAAGLQQILTGESGAVEIALGAQEVTDLALSGRCFTEVGSGHGDVLVELVDTTGLLRHLKKHVVRPDHPGAHPPHAEGEGGEGESGGGMTH